MEHRETTYPKHTISIFRFGLPAISGVSNFSQTQQAVRRELNGFFTLRRAGVTHLKVCPEAKINY
jgi:hypothetical protein